MKKTILTIAVVLIGISGTFANNEVGKNNDGKTKKDSNEVVKESSFMTNYISEKQRLEVAINGNIDPFASVSITNQRGSSILFSLVEKNSDNLVFDLSKLEKGIYNVMYITNEEIRIKKVELK
jgi:hypothetical protein